MEITWKPVLLLWHLLTCMPDALFHLTNLTHSFLSDMQWSHKGLTCSCLFIELSYPFHLFKVFCRGTCKMHICFVLLLHSSYTHNVSIICNLSETYFKAVWYFMVASFLIGWLFYNSLCHSLIILFWLGQQHMAIRNKKNTNNVNKQWSLRLQSCWKNKSGTKQCHRAVGITATAVIKLEKETIKYSSDNWIPIHGKNMELGSMNISVHI